jgi:hypothetical protein
MTTEEKGRYDEGKIYVGKKRRHMIPKGDALKKKWKDVEMEGQRRHMT